MAQRGTDLGEVRSGGARKDRPKITDKITLLKLPEKKWTTLRLFGPIYSYAGYWIRYADKETGKLSKRGFYAPAPSWDPNAQELDSTKFDPWRDVMDQERDLGIKREQAIIQFDRKYYVNAISRAAQKNKPAKAPKPTKAELKSGFKDKDSETWTPVGAFRMPGGLVKKLKDLTGLNTKEIKGETKSFPVTHLKYGVDVKVFYDPDAEPANQYQVQPSEKRSPLTEEELGYMKWDLSDLAGDPPSDDETRREYESWAKRIHKLAKKNGVNVMKPLKGGKGSDEDDESDDEDEDIGSKKNKKKGAKPSKKGKKSKADEDDEDEDLDGDDDFGDDEEDDEDEDDEPKSKKSKKSKADEDDDEDDESDDDEEDLDEDEDDESEDDDDFDDDEDEEPKSKKSKGKSKSVKKGKKSKSDDDEDIDDDDFGDDDEDEDDEPKSKKSKGKSKKSKSDDDDEEDDDDFGDDDDEDEDDEPKSKKSKQVKKGKKSKADEDDEDEDLDGDDDFGDDEEDDEDEDDEPKSKKSKAKPVKKGKKKSKK